MIAIVCWVLSCGQIKKDSGLVEPLFSNVDIHLELSNTPILLNERGDMFEIDTAVAVLYSIRFIECSNETSWYSPQDFFLPRALAGHSEIAIPSNWNRPTYLDLLQPHSIDTTISFPEQSICHLVLTWARWDGGTFDLPEPTPSTTFSVYVAGQCTAGDDQQQIDFILETAVPSEVVLPITFEELVIQSPDLKFALDIDVSDMLETIDCTSDLVDNPDRQALQVLYNLQQNATWTLEPK